MKSEQEIREWAISLRRDAAGHNDIPAMADSIRASLKAIKWILDDSPAADLVRVKDVLVDKFDEISGELWMFEKNEALNNLTPLQCVAIGQADEVIGLLNEMAPVTL